MKRNCSFLILALLIAYAVQQTSFTRPDKQALISVRQGRLSDHPSIKIETAVHRFLISSHWTLQGDHYGHQFVCVEGAIRENGVYAALLFERDGHSGIISMNSLELDGIKKNQTEIRMFLEEYFRN